MQQRWSIWNFVFGTWKFLPGLVLLCLFGATPSWAAADKVIKVLPHYLDLEGKESITPSLYDRDAYQAMLRKNPEKRSGFRFDIQWRAKKNDPLTLKAELRGALKNQPTTATIAKVVQHTSGLSRWTALEIKGDAYKEFGELVAWRISLWDGEKLVAERKSFLW